MECFIIIHEFFFSLIDFFLELLKPSAYIFLAVLVPLDINIVVLL